MAENTSKLGDINKGVLESIRSMLDANTIIGDPIQTASGTEIIPISKITVGYASGGVDYINKEIRTSNNFGGGGGTGLSVIPVAFMVIHTDGQVELLNIQASAEQGNDTVNAILTLAKKSPDIIAKFKEMFGKKDTNDSTETPEVKE